MPSEVVSALKTRSLQEQSQEQPTGPV